MGLSSRPLSVFHPVNASSDGWDTPQTDTPESRAQLVCHRPDQSHRTRAQEPSDQVGCRVGLYTFLYGNSLYGLYTIGVQRTRLVTARLSRYTAHTAHTAIQPLYTRIHHTALYSLPQGSGWVRLQCKPPTFTLAHSSATPRWTRPAPAWATTTPSTSAADPSLAPPTSAAD